MSTPASATACCAPCSPSRPPSRPRRWARAVRGNIMIWPSCRTRRRARSTGRGRRDPVRQPGRRRSSGRQAGRRDDGDDHAEARVEGLLAGPSDPDDRADRGARRVDPLPGLARRRRSRSAPRASSSRSCTGRSRSRACGASTRCRSRPRVSCRCVQPAVRAADVAVHCKLVGRPRRHRADTPFGSPTRRHRHRAAAGQGARARRDVHDLVRGPGAGRRQRGARQALRARGARAPAAVGDEEVRRRASTSPADEVTLDFAFSTPVTLDVARKAVKSKPAIARPRSGLPVRRRHGVPRHRGPRHRDRVPARRSRASSTRSARSSPRRDDARVPHRRCPPAALDGARHLRARGEREGLSAVVAQHRQVRARVRRDPERQARPGPDDRHELRPVGRQRRRQAARLEGAQARRRRRSRSRRPARTSGCSTSSSSARPARAQPACAACSSPRSRSDDIKPDPNRSWWNPRRNRVLANVTDMGVLIKTGTSSGLVWVTSLVDGQADRRREGRGVHAAGQAGVGRRHERRRPDQDPGQRAAQAAEAGR